MDASVGSLNVNEPGAGQSGMDVPMPRGLAGTRRYR
jgi:hypothetical protein